MRVYEDRMFKNIIAIIIKLPYRQMLGSRTTRHNYKLYEDIIYGLTFTFVTLLAIAILTSATCHITSSGVPCAGFAVGDDTS